MAGEDLFVEFFARTESGVFHFYVPVRNIASQMDHAAGQVVDLHGFSHIEDIDLISLAHRRGFHHEAACLWDGHKETGDLWMSDRHRTSLGDLLTEARDHGTIGPEDIAETGGHEPGATGFPAGFDGKAERLDVDLRKTLGAAHDVGRVHGLVRGDHDHLLHIVLDALISDIAGTGDIDKNCLTRVFLHERDMLVGRSMEDHLRSPFAEHIIKTRGKTDITDDRRELKFREIFLELEAEVVHRGLRIVEKHELPDSEACKLTAEF